MILIKNVQLHYHTTRIRFCDVHIVQQILCLPLGVGQRFGRREQLRRKNTV